MKKNKTKIDWSQQNKKKHNVQSLVPTLVMVYNYFVADEKRYGTECVLQIKSKFKYPM